MADGMESNLLMATSMGWSVVLRALTMAWAFATSLLLRISSSAAGAGAGAARMPTKELARAKRERMEVFMVQECYEVLFFSLEEDGE